MNKAELMEHVKKTANLGNAQALAAVDAVFGGITEALSRGERAAFHGFGSFTVKERAARKGRNPRTGKALLIPAGRRVQFIAARALKESISL